MKFDNNIYIEKLSLNGQWHEIDFDALQNGVISNINLAFLHKNPLTNYYYGITIFEKNNKVKYFIGIVSNNGNLDLSNHKYIVYSDINTDYIQPIYFVMASTKPDLLMMFGSSLNSNPIPVRIERYKVVNHEVTLDKILVPIK